MKSKIHEHQRITRVSKKIIFLFVLVTTLFSCSNEDNSNPTEVLQKVVFYRDSPNQRQWNISNNLLTNITLADGTVAEEFIYDSQNRLIRDIKYSNGSITETDIITYNTNNTINTINGLSYSYNAATTTYTYSYGSSFTINCQVNSDFLVENFVRTGTDAIEYHMTYTNGNMLSFEKSTSGTTDVIKNFHFDGTYGTNPLYSAVISVAKVKSLTDPSFFIDCQISENMANGFDKGTTDPYYYNYGLVFSDRFYQYGVEILDDSNNYIGYYTFASYYFQ